MNRNNVKRKRVNNRNAQNKIRTDKVALTKGPVMKSYAGEYHITHKIPGNNSLITTSPLGVAQAVYGIGNVTVGNIPNFNIKFGNTYDEYRIINFVVEVVPISINAGGVMVCWFDNINPNIPSFADANARSDRYIQIAAEGQKTFKFKWRCVDLGNLAFQGTTVSYLAGFFKLYTDAVNYAAPAAANSICILRPHFTIEFRGLRT